MKKNLKWLTALAAVGMMIGLVIAYFCKKNGASEFDEDDFEDEDDFDLDGDLKPVSEREYVPLNKAADQPSAKAEAESVEKKGTDPADAEDEKKEEKSEPEAEEADKDSASDKE